MDVARSIQAVTEEIMLRLARQLARLLARRISVWRAEWRSIAWPTGVFLREKIFDRIWIQPAAGDAGGALGAALAAWHCNCRRAMAGDRERSS